jgi:hypothetical protein
MNLERARLQRAVQSRKERGRKSVRENSSFALLGLDHFRLVPTAYAVGFILSQLRA